MSSQFSGGIAGEADTGHDDTGSLIGPEHELGRQQAQFRAALASRDVIGQAKGILMERYALDDTAAFALLRRYSRTTNTALREVAAEFVQTRVLPPLDAGRRGTTMPGG